MGQINCKEFADNVVEHVREQVDKLETKPHLVVFLVGDDKASEVYVRNKKKRCEQAGIKSTTVALPENTTFRMLENEILRANNDPGVTGILVQFPLPDHLRCYESVIISLIDPQKEVDGLHPFNQSQLLNDLHPRLEPCTPLGVLRLLEHELGRLDGLDVCLLGRSRLFGKPMQQMLLNHNCTVTQCHTKTKNLQRKTRNADVVILATGQAKRYGYGYFAGGSTVIDVGINRDEHGKLCGDVDTDNFGEYVNYTPVPGGVGLITTAILMENVLKAYKLQKGVY